MSVPPPVFVSPTDPAITAVIVADPLGTETSPTARLPPPPLVSVRMLAPIPAMVYPAALNCSPRAVMGACSVTVPKPVAPKIAESLLALLQTLGLVQLVLEVSHCRLAAPFVQVLSAARP